MQRTRSNGKRLNIALSVALLFFIIIFDQLTKCYFHQLFNEASAAGTSPADIVIIKDFLTFSVTFNEGAAFGLFGDKPWAQTFFKVLTCFALVCFYVYYMLVGKEYKFLGYGVMSLFGGIIGNFIDRLAFGKVVDFISFKFGAYYFPTFNIADMAITVGVIILIIHYLFLDKDCLFKSKKRKEAEKTE